MAIWYDCGNGWRKTIGWASSDLGADLYLCCPGPSLRDVNPDSLQVPGAFVFAMNTAYPHITRPDLWIGMDTVGCYDSRLMWEPFPKIIRGTYKDETIAGQPLKHQPSTYFADCDMGQAIQMFARRNHDATFVFNSSTFIMALHISVWMGARKIYLVGSDFGGATDYYDQRVLSKTQRSRNHELYRRIVGVLPQLRDNAKANGIELISATPDSAANIHLPFVHLDDALRLSQGSVSSLVSSEPLHTLDAIRCRWGHSGEFNGILTGADESAEWMLPWWFDNLREHNPDLKVAFADFGMSPQMRQWCRRRGHVVEVPEAGPQAWHRKPFALMKCGFQRMAWIDADCEIRGPLDQLFDFASEGIGLTLDPHSQWIEQPGGLATGVVACSHGEPAIEEWGKAILAGEHRGDQEALNSIRGRLQDRITIMPPELQRLRLDGDSSEATIMHWTGPDGKSRIAHLKVAG